MDNKAQRVKKESHTEIYDHYRDKKMKLRGIGKRETN